MSADTSTVAYLFNRVYSDRNVADAVTRDRPFSRMIKKSKGVVVGEDFRYKVKYGNPGSVGGTFATTQTAAGTSKGMAFATTPAKKYGVITLDGLSMLRSSGKGATIELARNETDGVLDEMAAHLSFDLLHSGNGVRGRRSSISGNIVTLVDPNSARNFYVGMPIGASSLSTGLSPRAGANTTVASVDISGGTITLTDASQITTFSDNDYLFVPGEPGTCVDGIGSIIPQTAPASGDSFRGQDRSVDTQRLAGARLNSTSTPIHENIGVLATLCQMQGKKPDTAWLSPTNLFTVVRQLQNKVEYAGGGTADYGFEYVNVRTPGGTLKCFADPDMPDDKFYIGKMDEMEVLYLGDEYVHIIRADGNASLRQTTSDGIEIRAGAFSQPVVYMPASFGVSAI